MQFNISSNIDLSIQSLENLKQSLTKKEYSLSFKDFCIIFDLCCNLENSHPETVKLLCLKILVLLLYDDKCRGLFLLLDNRGRIWNWFSKLASSAIFNELHYQWLHFFTELSKYEELSSKFMYPSTVHTKLISILSSRLKVSITSFSSVSSDSLDTARLGFELSRLCRHRMSEMRNLNRSLFLQTVEIFTACLNFDLPTQDKFNRLRLSVLLLLNCLFKFKVYFTQDLKIYFLRFLSLNMVVASEALVCKCCQYSSFSIQAQILYSNFRLLQTIVMFGSSEDQADLGSIGFVSWLINFIRQLTDLPNMNCTKYCLFNTPETLQHSTSEILQNNKSKTLQRSKSGILQYGASESLCDTYVVFFSLFTNFNVSQFSPCKRHCENYFKCCYFFKFSVTKNSKTCCNVRIFDSVSTVTLMESFIGLATESVNRMRMRHLGVLCDIFDHITALYDTQQLCCFLPAIICLFNQFRFDDPSLKVFDRHGLFTIMLTYLSRNCVDHKRNDRIATKRCVFTQRSIVSTVFDIMLDQISSANPSLSITQLYCRKNVSLFCCLSRIYKTIPSNNFMLLFIRKSKHLQLMICDKICVELIKYKKRNILEEFSDICLSKIGISLFCKLFHSSTSIVLEAVAITLLSIHWKNNLFLADWLQTKGLLLLINSCSELLKQKLSLSDERVFDYFAVFIFHIHTSTVHLFIDRSDILYVDDDSHHRFCRCDQEQAGSDCPSLLSGLVPPNHPDSDRLYPYDWGSSVCFRQPDGPVYVDGYQLGRLSEYFRSYLAHNTHTELSCGSISKLIFQPLLHLLGGCCVHNCTVLCTLPSHLWLSIPPLCDIFLLPDLEQFCSTTFREILCTKKTDYKQIMCFYMTSRRMRLEAHFEDINDVTKPDKSFVSPHAPSFFAHSPSSSTSHHLSSSSNFHSVSSLITGDWLELHLYMLLLIANRSDSLGVLNFILSTWPDASHHVIADITDILMMLSRNRSH